MGVRIKLDQKTPGEQTDFHINLAPRLADDETLSGTVTVTEIATEDLTVSGAAVVDETYTRGSKSVAAGRGVKFRVGGGADGKTYDLLVSVDTAGGRTVQVYCSLPVTDGA